MSHWVMRWTILLVVLSSSWSVQAQTTKVALAIGINNYNYAPRLKNPVSDAISVARVLRQIGFDVILATDLDRSSFEFKLSEFARKAARADITIVYYAGHGIQVNGNSYLIPADAELNEERDVRKLIRAEDILQDAARAGRLAVVIFDACRNNPFTRSLAEALGASRSTAVGLGLSRISAVPRNTLIAYSTQAGNVALDGSGANSPYATALMQHLRTPMKDIRMVFGAVRDRVLDLTDQSQEPFTYGSLGGEPLYLNSTGATAISGRSGTDENFSVAINPTLTTTAFIVPQVPNGARPITNEFAAWQIAKRGNNWTKIEQFRIERRKTLYGFVSEELLKLHTANPGMSVEGAITALSNVRADISRLPRPITSLLQRKLSKASYYGGAATGIADTQTREALYAFVRDIYGSGTISFQTLLVLSELADSQNVTESLSGNWKGTYYYAKPLNGISSVPFEMNLVLSQGRVTGHVSEPNTFGNKTSANLYANFSGKIFGSHISWKKTYDGTGGVSHSVFYSGTLDRKKRRVEGTWRITANWSGRFHIQLK